MAASAKTMASSPRPLPRKTFATCADEKKKKKKKKKKKSCAGHRP